MEALRSIGTAIVRGFEQIIRLLPGRTRAIDQVANDAMKPQNTQQTKPLSEKHVVQHKESKLEKAKVQIGGEQVSVTAASSDNLHPKYILDMVQNLCSATSMIDEVGKEINFNSLGTVGMVESDASIGAIKKEFEDEKEMGRLYFKIPVGKSRLPTIMYNDMPVERGKKVYLQEGDNAIKIDNKIVFNLQIKKNI